MRSQHILTIVARRIPVGKASWFASADNFRGGWEGWLQAEIAHAFYEDRAATEITREQPYPSGLGAGHHRYLAYNPANGMVATAAHPAARCDFYVRRPAVFGPADESYLELKCISPSAMNAVDDAWNRFRADVTKIDALRARNQNLVCTALLATWGTFNPIHVRGDAPTLRWCWAGNRTAYVVDFRAGQPVVSTLANVATGGDERLFIVAVSV